MAAAVERVAAVAYGQYVRVDEPAGREYRTHRIFAPLSSSSILNIDLWQRDSSSQ